MNSNTIHIGIDIFSFNVLFVDDEGLKDKLNVMYVIILEKMCIYR